MCVFNKEVRKKEYLRFMTEKYNFREEFFSNVHVLNKLSIHRLRHLFKSLKEITFKASGSIIYKEKDDAKHLYVIKYGLVEISKKIKVTDPHLK